MAWIASRSLTELRWVWWASEGVAQLLKRFDVRRAVAEFLSHDYCWFITTGIVSVG
jgi:hypothetical protein